MGTGKDVSLRFQVALVTGGGGFVGKAVVKQLLDRGVEVRVIGRNRYPDLEKLGVTCFTGDLADFNGLCRACKGVEVVFHVAALAGIWGPWDDYYRTNVLGTENVVNACKANGVKALVYTSTPSVVFDRKNIVAGDESLAYASNFLCSYAKSKVIAEKNVLENLSTPSCALRPHLIWGPSDPHLLPRLLAAGRKKQLKMVGDGDNLVDISYIDNVAHAHLLAAQNLTQEQTAAGQAYFISQGEPVNLWDWINELFELMGVERITKRISYKTAYKIGASLEFIYKVTGKNGEPKMSRFLAEQLAKSHYFSCEKARRDFGYTPIISTREGLEKTVHWLKNHDYQH
ncbi:MAG: nucleoside-diphosphate-sugar epimerase [Desulforhopalus sp.]|jgi:nucleoside-diphosphate-sugar epimerase